MKKILPIIMILSLLLTSCGAKTEKTDKPVVYSSFYAMDSFVQTIGGGDIEHYSIVPTGGEPHDFEPSARDIAKLSEADLFVYNGAGIDDWAEDVAETLPDTVEVLRLSEQADDPHVWLDSGNAQAEIAEITSKLSEIDPEHADNYKKRQEEYSRKIRDIYYEYKNAGLEGKKLFVTHGAYGHLCAGFGMEQIALEGVSGDSDPSPAQMAKIVNEIKADGAKRIFYDPLEKSKLADAVASEAGIQTAPLYTFEGDSENRDYLTIMKLNLEQLKKGL